MFVLLPSSRRARVRRLAQIGRKYVKFCQVACGILCELLAGNWRFVSLFVMALFPKYWFKLP